MRSLCNADGVVTEPAIDSEVKVEVKPVTPMVICMMVVVTNLEKGLCLVKEGANQWMTFAMVPK